MEKGPHTASLSLRLCSATSAFDSDTSSPSSASEADAKSFDHLSSDGGLEPDCDDEIFMKWSKRVGSDA